MYRTGPRLFWPIILIGVGVIFLLNNLGVITGSPWEVIWRLWPVLLIALGLGNSHRAHGRGRLGSQRGTGAGRGGRRAVDSHRAPGAARLQPQLQRRTENNQRRLSAERRPIGECVDRVYHRHQ